MAFDILWMNVAAVFAILNVALVFLLLGLYYQSWRKLRSALTISLMIFAIFFLVQNLIIIVFWYALYGLVPAAEGIVVAAAPYLVLINLMQTAGLGNLVRVTWG